MQHEAPLCWDALFPKVVSLLRYAEQLPVMVRTTCYGCSIGHLQLEQRHPAIRKTVTSLHIAL